jgi:predicted ester cyclase
VKTKKKERRTIMSTEENKALSRRVTEEIWNKKNLALADELIDANWVMHGTGGMEFKGREGFKQFFTTFTTAFPDFHVAIDDMVAEGDKVACRLTTRGTHKGDLMGIAPTGKQFTVTGIIISRSAGGKEAEMWLINDQLGMMQQLGVVPPVGQG